MNARTKSALIVVCTFVAGLAVGILATNYVVQQRLDRMRDLRSRSGYSQTIMEAIQPNTDAQREQVRAILQQTHDSLELLRREWSIGVQAEGDSMRVKLNEILTPEQRASLNEWLERHQRRRHRDGDRNGDRDGGDRDGDRDRRRGDRRDSVSERGDQDDGRR